jgi:hypothetical protein
MNNISVDLSRYSTVFCDSLKALEWAYHNGLPSNAVIKTSSPAMLSSNNKHIKHVENRWTVNEMKLFQQSISKFSEDIFNELINNKIRRDIALAITQELCKSQHVLYKAACLNTEDINDKRLFIKIDAHGGAKGNLMNSPWDDILHGFSGFHTINYKLIGNSWASTSLNTNSISLLYRLRFAGFKTIVFRLLSNISRFIPYFLTRFQILVPSENELLLDAAGSLVLKGGIPCTLVVSNLEYVEDLSDDIDDILNTINIFIDERLNRWVIPELHKNCRKIFSNRIMRSIMEIKHYRSQWRDSLLSKVLKNPAVLINSPCNAPGFALTQLCYEHRIPTFSFQHGVTQEINAYHDEVSISYEINTSDHYFAFNNQSKIVSERSYFKRGDAFTVGISNRHLGLFSDKYNDKIQPIIYISTNIYKGNVNAFCGFLTDYERAINEMNLVDKVLSKIPYDLSYKPYPEENKRYADVDPVFNLIEKFDNIEIEFDKIDVRYLVKEYRIMITSSATSTMTWPLFSSKPLIYIEWDNNSRLKKDAYNLLKNSTFLFDSSSKSFHNDLKVFLSKPLDEIESMYRDKLYFRKKLIKKYFTEYKSNSGVRAAKYIFDIINKGADT